MATHNKALHWLPMAVSAGLYALAPFLRADLAGRSRKPQLVQASCERHMPG